MDFDINYNVYENEVPESQTFAFILFVLTCLCFYFLAWYRNSLNGNEREPPSYNIGNDGSIPSENCYKSNDELCPICRDKAGWPVQTNCGHTFCCLCFISYFEHLMTLSTPPCPLCRNKVNILIPQWPSVLDKNQDNHRYDNNENIVKQLKAFNRRFSGEKIPIYDQIRDLPVMLKHFLLHILSNENITLLYRCRIIFCILMATVYFVVPKDFIPESAFGFVGLIDDALILFIILLHLVACYRQVHVA